MGVAFECGDEATNYVELEGMVRGFEAALDEGFLPPHPQNPLKVGVVFGDYGSMTPPTLALVVALQRKGCWVCLLNPKWPATWLGPRLKEWGIGVVFVSEDNPAQSLLDDGKQVHSVRRWLGAAKDRLPTSSTSKRSRPDPRQQVFGVATSGSTSIPKMALLTTSNLLRSAAGLQPVARLRPGSKWLLSLPLHHVSGLAIVVRCLAYGATVVVPQGDLRTTLVGGGITHLSLVDSQLHDLVGEEEALRALGRLQAILVGGGTLSKETWNLRRTLPLHPTYGLTEMASQVGLATKNTPIGWFGVLRHRKVRVRNNKIFVKGPCLFKGYLGSGGGDAIDLPLDEDGWLCTGDVGLLNRRRLQVTGRVDHQFISGGENIQPEAIESVLQKHFGLPTGGVVVLPEPDPKWGFVPVAVVGLEDETRTIAWQKQASRDGLRALLPNYMVPKKYYRFPRDWGAMNSGALASKATPRKALLKKLRAGELALLP